MKAQNTSHDWSNIDLSSPSERDLNLLDPYDFDTLLLEINCNLREITAQSVTEQFNESLNSKIETAKEIFKNNLQSILKTAIAERNNDELEEAKPLKERILKAFPGAQFGRHETDLYVKIRPGLEEWLRSNYEFYSNVQRFTSQVDKTRWLDIPFAAWDEKYK